MATFEHVDLESEKPRKAVVTLVELKPDKTNQEEYNIHKTKLSESDTQYKMALETHNKRSKHYKQNIVKAYALVMGKMFSSYAE